MKNSSINKVTHVYALHKEYKTWNAQVVLLYYLAHASQ